MIIAFSYFCRMQMKGVRSVLILAGSLLFLFSCTEKMPPAEVEKEPVICTERFVLPPLPEAVSFCSVSVPINDFDMQERLDKELIVNTYYHSSTIQSLKRANRYFAVLEKELKAAGIPEDFKYLCMVESNFAQVTSPSGAKGFWQFMPETAKEFNLRVDREVDERLHIVKSTQAACAYLRQAYNRLGDWTLVAASYNMGIGGVEKALKEQEVDSYFDLYLNNETSRYVFRILAMKLIFENQQAYGFNQEELELYDPIETRHVELGETVENLMSWARKQGTTYRKLKLLNPWIKGDKLTVKKGESLTIELPK